MPAINPDDLVPELQRDGDSDSPPFLMRGYLHIASNSQASKWKRRFFVLDEQHLWLFPNANSRPRQQFRISGVTAHQMRFATPPRGTSGWGLVFKPPWWEGRATQRLCATGEYEAVRWLAALRVALNREKIEKQKEKEDLEAKDRARQKALADLDAGGELGHGAGPSAGASPQLGRRPSSARDQGRALRAARRAAAETLQREARGRRVRRGLRQQARAARLVQALWRGCLHRDALGERLQDGMALDFKGGKPRLEKGDMLLFDSDILHAGSSYKQQNTLSFMYCYTAGCPAPGNQTYIES
eukprot:g1486.t1